MDKKKQRAIELRRIKAAVRIIESYGGIGGSKQWCLDQVLRRLLGPKGYEAWRNRYRYDHDNYGWDEGCAPEFLGEAESAAAKQWRFDQELRSILSPKDYKALGRGLGT